MGRTRNILDLTMAGSAIAAIVILSVLQFRQERSAFQAISPAQATSTQVAEAPPTPEIEAPEVATPEAPAKVEIAHFLGIAQFVKNPTEYEWVCDTDCGSTAAVPQLAKITKASLAGDQMTISYSTSVENEGPSKRQSDAKIGQLVGTLNSDGTFAGTYQLQSEKGINEGPVSFTFAADGTAKSATGATKIAQ